jgi:hypothetical protein
MLARQCNLLLIGYQGICLKVWYADRPGTFLGKHHTPETKLKMHIAKQRLAEEKRQAYVVAV